MNEYLVSLKAAVKVLFPKHKVEFGEDGDFTRVWIDDIPTHIKFTHKLFLMILSISESDAFKDDIVMLYLKSIKNAIDDYNLFGIKEEKHYNASYNEETKELIFEEEENE